MEHSDTLKSTEESLSTLADREVEDAVTQPPIEKAISTADVRGLKKVLLTDEEINAVSAGHDQAERTSQSSVEAVIKFLTGLLAHYQSAN